jgi:hypothetical protein
LKGQRMVKGKVVIERYRFRMEEREEEDRK